MQTLADDVRYAWRVMGKAPGFAAASVFMLAIGIGANTAIFTIIDAVLLRPLPFPQSQQLVRITADLTGRGARDVGVSAQELVDYQQQGDLFASVSGDYPINENLTGTDEPERLEGQLVSASYFELLGAHARLGRVFGPQDYAPGVAEVAVISDGLWKRRFGQDPNIVGRKIRLDNDLFTIIGVMPPGFRHPGRRIQGEPEIWSPCGYRATPFPAPLRSTFLLSGVIARLQPGVSVAAAQARIDVLGAALRRQYPGDYPSDMGWRPRIEPLQDSLTGSARQPLWLLFGAVSMVLLIACANVANLLLARASARRREFAVRQALGAGVGRLMRQLLTESIVLSLAAGALGVLLASWSLAALVRFAPPDVPLMADMSIDRRVLFFSMVIVISERFARRFFPGEDPIGRRIRPGRANSIAPWLTIVGIVSDVRSVSLGAEPEAQLYRCVWQGSGLVMALVVRGRADETMLEGAIRSDVSAIDPELPLYAVRPMTSVIAQATAERRFSMVLFGLFAGAALLLAALGIYAMMAYLVRQRSHEIGIRLALGARPADAIALVLRRGLALTLTGAAIGVAGGALVARMMAGLLFGVSVIDPVSFIAAPLILTLVSLAACYIPALRAAHIDPIQTLRAE